MKRLCFILSYSPNPRIRRRVDCLKDSFCLDLVFWKRNNQDFWGGGKNDNWKQVDIPANQGNPISRINATRKYFLEVNKFLRTINPNVLYVENLDMLFIATLYKFINFRKIAIVYEVADLHELILYNGCDFKKKLISSFVKLIERYLCKKINLLVLTSQKYYSIYYKDFISNEKVLVFPNVPDTRLFKNYQKVSHKKFTIGFIGAIRYIDQMKLLIRVAERAGVTVLFAGNSLDDSFKDYCAQYSHVHFYGKYDYSNEISNLYTMIDCVYSVYDIENKNVKIAIPNKLYEAIYCELPIIVSENTYLAELVQSYNVGIAIDSHDEEELYNIIIKLSTDYNYYKLFVNNCIKVKSIIDLDQYNRKLKGYLIDV